MGALDLIRGSVGVMKRLERQLLGRTHGLIWRVRARLLLKRRTEAGEQLMGRVKRPQDRLQR